MRRILCKIPRRPATTVCAAVDGGRATIAASFPTAGDGFLPTGPKPNVRTFVKVEEEEAKFTDIFGVFARKQLKNEERARKALGILFRNYGGRANEFAHVPADDEKVAKTKNIRKITEEELDVFVTNLEIECETNHEKYKYVCKVFQKVIEKMNRDDDLGYATQNDRVDELAEIAEEELDAFLTSSFTTKLMIECEPKYEKRFRQVIEKMRKKMIQDDETFKALTKLMNRCDPEYEKLLREILDKVLEKITQDEEVGNENTPFYEEVVTCFEKFVTELMNNCEPEYEVLLHQVLERVRKKEIQDYKIMKEFYFKTCIMSKGEPDSGKHVRKVVEKLRENIVREKITQDEKVGNENVGKIEKLTRLGMKVGNVGSYEEKLEKFVTNIFLKTLRMVEETKLDFMAYEVIEKVANRLGNENVRKIAEAELDKLATGSFLTQMMRVDMKKFLMEYNVLETQKE